LPEPSDLDRLQAGSFTDDGSASSPDSGHCVGAANDHRRQESVHFINEALIKK
jgi:hypothetical protein